MTVLIKGLLGVVRLPVVQSRNVSHWSQQGTAGWASWTLFFPLRTHHWWRYTGPARIFAYVRTHCRRLRIYAVATLRSYALCIVWFGLLCILVRSDKDSLLLILSRCMSEIHKKNVLLEVQSWIKCRKNHLQSKWIGFIGLKKLIKSSRG